MISLYGSGFARPTTTKLNFSSTGNSHAFELIAPKYFNDEEYSFIPVTNEKYTVLIDNGINNQSNKFKSVFPNATIIKICYTDYSWPIIARTMIKKAMNVEFESEINLASGGWQTSDDWALREKYFLFLRDHNLRTWWKADHNCLNLHIEDLLQYQQLVNQLEKFGIDMDCFRSDWQQWRAANKTYIDHIDLAQNIIKSVKLKKRENINHITDIWTQSVIYYFIWLTYNFEVPHNDYSIWFTNTNDIVIMLNNYGVQV